MWEKIKSKFKDFPAQQLVVLTMLRQGLRVDEKTGRIFCGDIEMSSSKFGRGIGVDRRAVTAAAERIAGDEELKIIFSHLRPAADISKVAKQLGFGIVELRAEAHRSGIFAKVTSMVAEKGLSIRQILCDDPELFPEPKATIITERPVPGELLNEFLKIEGILEVHVK